MPIKSGQSSKLEHVFIDKNNTIYVTDSHDHLIYEWRNSSNSPTRIISYGLYEPRALFVSSASDFYVNYGDDGQVNKWKATTNSFETVAQFCDTCFAIFIDVNDTIYCSMKYHHQIVTKLLHSNLNMITVFAGVGIEGSEAHMLHYPHGIFVNINLDLYVADTSNDRIQLFRSNTVKGTTIAGIPNTISLNNPTSVVLDANNYIYILDTGYNRIVSGTSNGFRCIVSCGEESDSSNQLTYPSSMAFDSFGNLYVTDSDNDRVQKFLLSKNTFGEFNRSDIGLRYYFNNILFSHTNRTN